MAITTKAALADELGITRARVSQYVKAGMPVRPDGKLNRDEALNWVAQTHLSQTLDDKGVNRARRIAHQVQKRPQPAKTQPSRQPVEIAPRRFDPGWPEAYRANCEKADFLGGLCVMTAMRMVYDAPAIAATMAVHAGASMATAYRLKELLTVALMVQAEQVLQEMNVQPFASGEELDWSLERIRQNDWAHLAEVAGEPHDEVGWHTAMLKANAEQMGEAHV